MSTLSSADLYELLGTAFHNGPQNPHAISDANAIISRESGGKTNARNYNYEKGASPTPRTDMGRLLSIDRGIWQWNNKAWPHISDKCADDPICATAQAARISHNGTNWDPWNSSGNTTPGFSGGKSNPTPGNADSAGLFGVGSGPGADTVISGAANAVLKPAEAFFKLITSLNFWLRVGEAIAAFVLIAMGLRQLTGVNTGPIVAAGGKFVPSTSI